MKYYYRKCVDWSSEEPIDYLSTESKYESEYEIDIDPKFIERVSAIIKELDKAESELEDEIQRGISELLSLKINKVEVRAPSDIISYLNDPRSYSEKNDFLLSRGWEFVENHSYTKNSEIFKMHEAFEIERKAFELEHSCPEEL